jgi:hypothetical protein
MTINGVLIAVASVMGAGAWEQGRKMRDRGRNDKKTVQRMLDENNECNTFDDLTEASQFLSCIVTGVYKRCKCPQQEQQRPYFQHIDQHWTHWGYEVVDFDNLAGTYDEVHEDRCRVGDLGQPKDQCVRAVLFERSDSQVPGSYIIPPTKLKLKFHFMLCNGIRMAHRSGRSHQSQAKSHHKPVGSRLHRAGC